MQFLAPFAFYPSTAFLSPAWSWSRVDLPDINLDFHDSLFSSEGLEECCKNAYVSFRFSLAMK